MFFVLYFSSLAYKSLPSLEYDIFTASGARGWIGSWHSHVNDESLVPYEDPMARQLIDETRLFIGMSTPRGISRVWTLKLRGFLKPRPYDCTFEFELTVAGRARV